MENATKEELIIAFFRHDRTFEAGRQLYNNYGINHGLKTRFNNQGENDFNREILFYELSKIAGISETDFNQMLLVPVISPEEYGETVGAKNEDKIDFGVTLIEGATASPEALAGWKLRDQYPFLKEENCPEILIILVNKMLNAWEKWHTAHEELFNTASPEVIAELSAMVVDNYLEDSAIKAELDYYLEHRSVLGNHPLFGRTKRLEELKALSIADLVKLSKNIPTNISRIKKNIKEKPDDKKVSEWQISLDNYTWELNEVNHLLNK